MALNKEQKKNTILIFIMIISVAATVYFLTDFGGTDDDIELSTNQATSVPSPAIPNNVNESVFNTDIFRSLEDNTPPSFPLEPRGRENPFVAVPGSPLRNIDIE